MLVLILDNVNGILVSIKRQYSRRDPAKFATTMVVTTGVQYSSIFSDDEQLVWINWQKTYWERFTCWDDRWPTKVSQWEHLRRLQLASLERHNVDYIRYKL